MPRCALLLASVAAALLSLGAITVAGHAQEVDPLKLADTQLEPVKWTDLEGWIADDHAAAFATFQRSCRAVLGAKRTHHHRPVHVSLAEICRRAVRLNPSKNEQARTFFEESFLPVRIARLGEKDGFLTGYYEPVVEGSRFPSPEFHVPLYRRPRDLVAAGHKPGAEGFPNKGALIGRRNEKNDIVPYHDRAAIEDGALDGQRLEICWLKDPFEALSISIQGSARVILEDGTPLRVNYDSHNGYPYTAVGRALIERNHIPRDEMSMQRIREWMSVNPGEAREVRHTNRSYVFFRITGLSNEGEPAGAQGVPLTPLRSIAVDKIHIYGTPFYIEAKLPIESAKPSTSFHRLMIAQDTGSAIVGPARADLYWGTGVDAGRIAGRIRHPARLVMLLPRDLDMVAAGKQMPLPLKKPVTPQDEVKHELHKKSGKSAADGTKTSEQTKKKSRRQAGPDRSRPRT